MSEFEKELECRNCEFECTVIHTDEDAVFVGMWFCPACGELIEDENEETWDSESGDEDEEYYRIVDE